MSLSCEPFSENFWRRNFSTLKVVGRFLVTERSLESKISMTLKRLFIGKSAKLHRQEIHHVFTIHRVNLN